MFTLQSADLGVDPSVLCALRGRDSTRVGGLKGQTRYLLGFFCLCGGAEAGHTVKMPVPEPVGLTPAPTRGN